MTTTPSITAATCSDAPIWNAWMSAFHAPTLAIADELGVFAAVRDEPATAAVLAKKLGIEVRATEAIAGVMTALEFLVLADGRYGLTEASRTYLLPESPYYWGGMLKRIRDNPLDCRKLIESLRRGNAAAEARLSEMWQAPTPPPEALVAFTHAMHAHSFALAMRSMPAFGLATVGRLLDVAGGSGSYSIAAAVHHPELQVSLLDLPAVCTVAAQYAEKHGVSSRVTTVPGNMFADAWPTGHERILMSDIFHDWDDAQCLQLAKRAHAALPPGGRLMLHEMLLNDSKDGPAAAVAYSMVMVFVTEGRQRSARELLEILASAGFAEIRITMTSGGYALVEGTRQN
jgi:hypothetical protein